MNENRLIATEKYLEKWGLKGYEFVRLNSSCVRVWVFKDQPLLYFGNKMVYVETIVNTLKKAKEIDVFETRSPIPTITFNSYKDFLEYFLIKKLSGI